MALSNATVTPIPEAGSVIGVDVGFSPKRRSSAVCRLDWTASRIDISVGRYRSIEPERTEVLSRMVDRPIIAAAFDGPLRSDLEVIGMYRHAELMLTRRLQPFIGKPGQSSAPTGKLLNHNANICAKIVIDTGVLAAATHRRAIHGSAIAEAFPSSFLGLMIMDPKGLQASRGNRSDSFYIHLAASGGLNRLLEYLLPSRELAVPFDAIKNHDERAAVVCALTALCIAVGEYTAVGDHNGWIILPPPSFIQQWAWKELSVNAQENEGLEWLGFRPAH